MSFDTAIQYSAGADLSTKQFYVVKDNGSGAAVVVAADTDLPLGILQNAPASGQGCELGVGPNVVKGILGGNVAKGDLVGPDGNGKLVKRTVGTDATKYVLGVAGLGGVANDIVPIRLTPVPFRAA